MTAEVVWPWLGPKMPALTGINYCTQYKPNTTWSGSTRPACGYRTGHEGDHGWWDGSEWQEWPRDNPKGQNDA